MKTSEIEKLVEKEFDPDFPIWERNPGELGLCHKNYEEYMGFWVKKYLDNGLKKEALFSTLRLIKHNETLSKSFNGYTLSKISKNFSRAELVGYADEFVKKSKNYNEEIINTHESIYVSDNVHLALEIYLHLGLAIDMDSVPSIPKIRSRQDLQNIMEKTKDENFYTETKKNRRLLSKSFDAYTKHQKEKKHETVLLVNLQNSLDGKVISDEEFKKKIRFFILEYGKNNGQPCSYMYEYGVGNGKEIMFHEPGYKILSLKNEPPSPILEIESGFIHRDPNFFEKLGKYVENHSFFYRLNDSKFSEVVTCFERSGSRDRKKDLGPIVYAIIEDFEK